MGTEQGIASHLLNRQIGIFGNDGAQRYMVEAESSSGFVAWQMDDGTTLVGEALQLSIRQSASIRFWACAGYQDTSPCGVILAFDCHDNALTRLEVTGLSSLQYLDCSFNELRSLELTGLSQLEGLDVDNNRLTTLSLSTLRALRVLNCASNDLYSLDASGLDTLEVLDCTGNSLTDVNVAGCSSLRETRGLP